MATETSVRNAHDSSIADGIRGAGKIQVLATGKASTWHYWRFDQTNTTSDDAASTSIRFVGKP